MSTRTNFKCARAITEGEASVPTTALESSKEQFTSGFDEMLAEIKPEKYLALLVEAATRHQGVMDAIRAARDDQRALEIIEGTLFNQYVRYANRTFVEVYLVDKHHQFEDIMEGIRKSEDGIQKIAKAVVHNPHSSFTTKFNAISTICDVYQATFEVTTEMCSAAGKMLYMGFDGIVKYWGGHLIAVLGAFGAIKLRHIIKEEKEWLNRLKGFGREVKEWGFEGDIFKVEEAVAMIRGVRAEEIS